VDSERVRYAFGERPHDIWCVKNDRDGDREHDELHESCDLTGEQEEDRNDPDDPEEQRPEQALQVRNQTLRTQGHWTHRSG
jgi:hypothetical protein